MRHQLGGHFFPPSLARTPDRQTQPAALDKLSVELQLSASSPLVAMGTDGRDGEAQVAQDKTVREGKTGGGYEDARQLLNANKQQRRQPQNTEVGRLVAAL